MTTLRRILQWPFLQRQERLLEARKHHSREAFLKSVGADDVAAAVWEALQHEAVVEGFKPMPEDDLGTIFGIADDDLDEVSLTLLQLCGCRIPLPSETRNMPAVTTVLELIHFVRAMLLPTHPDLGQDATNQS
jgi:hypothetical protein